MVYHSQLYFELEIFFNLKNLFQCEKIKIVRYLLQFFSSNYHHSSVTLSIPMIASEKLHQSLSNYIQFLFKNRFQVNIKYIISSEKNNPFFYSIKLFFE